jgi:hypothetical protein
MTRATAQPATGNTGQHTVTIAMANEQLRTAQWAMLSDDEMDLVAAICNRVGRMIGLLDRDGLHRDFEILQGTYPLDLEALVMAPDRVFVDELLRIIESTDRAAGTLRDDFESRFRYRSRLEVPD